MPRETDSNPPAFASVVLNMLTPRVAGPAIWIWLLLSEHTLHVVRHTRVPSASPLEVADIRAQQDHCPAPVSIHVAHKRAPRHARALLSDLSQYEGTEQQRGVLTLD